MLIHLIRHAHAGSRKAWPGEDDQRPLSSRGLAQSKAIATTLAGWVNALQLGRGLVVRGHFKFDARFMRNLPLIMLASAVMGVVLWFALPFFTTFIDPARLAPVKFGAMALLILLGCVVFFAVVHVTGVLRLGQFARMLSRK